MNTENLIRIETRIENIENVNARLIVRAHESVDSENPFECDNIKLNGEPIKGREFSLTIFDKLMDSESGLIYKFITNSNGITDIDEDMPSYIRPYTINQNGKELLFPQIITFKDGVQISECLATYNNMKEMSLKPVNSYLNRIFGDFGQHIFFDIMEKYINASKYELRSVNEKYPYKYIPILTDKTIYTDYGYIEIKTYHDGEIIESSNGMAIITNPTYIISVEHPYVKVDKSSYDPEPERYRELVVDTSKSLFNVAKLMEELTKDIIIW